MVDLSILKAHGLTDENLRKWLTGDPKQWLGMAATTPEMKSAQATGETLPPEQQRLALHNRIRSRVQEGLQRNFSTYRTYYALDQAWDQPFKQISPTLVSAFINSNPSSDEVYKQFASWGMSDMIAETKDEKSGQTVKKFNLPVFFNIFVPLVRCYVEKVWAEQSNRQLQTPWVKYEPAKRTTPLRIKCEAITDRIEIMRNQYGYFDVCKQAILKMLHYSFCIQFPEKEWTYEEQWRKATEQDVKNGKTKPAPTDTDENATAPVSVGDEIKVTVKEGITYHLPHPTRLYWDMAHGKHTMNYGYGCQFAGYWRIIRYRDVFNSNYWNKAAIALGSADLISGNRMFFSTVYSACTLTIPSAKPLDQPSPTGATLGAEVGAGISPLDREKQIATQYYGTEHGDQGCLVTEHFEKLIPKDNGLGTYDQPVWFRFVLAGDGCTILYAAPLPYDPLIYWGYAADESRAENASLSLKILPFQDHFSNVMSQILLTAKQNLANMALIDEDQVTDDQIRKVQNLGAGLYQSLNIFGFSGKKAFRGQNKVTEALQTFNLPKGNVGELTNVLKTILDVLERVLVISSQQVAQQASHEQTREEVRVIGQSTEAIAKFNATPADIAIGAWKRQLYQGLMAYGDDDIYAMLPSDIALSKEVLEKMGFTFVDHDDNISSNDRYRMVKTTKKITAMELWQFAATRDGDDRSSDVEQGRTMTLLVQSIMSNPMLAQTIGPDQLLDLLNETAQLIGLRRDFKLRNANPNASPEQQQQQKQAELQQILQAVMAQVGKEIQPLLEHVKEIDQQVGHLAQIAGAVPPPAPPAPAIPGQQ